MYERPHRARVLFVVLLLAAVTVISLDFREQSGGPIDRFQRTATSIFGPLQQGVSNVLRPIGGFFSGIGELRDLRRDNRDLKGEVERLRVQERTHADLLSENKVLRRTLGMAQRCGCRTVGAKVVARSVSNFQRSVTIDAGARQGVAVDMAVINGDGLVGRVVQVGDGYANVLLLVDPSSGVAATLGDTRAPGLLRGRGDRQLELELLQPDAKVKVGEPVVTQGYREGVFPPGLPIGVVTKVPPVSALVRRIAVRPFASSDNLDLVGVVIEQPAAPNTPPVSSALPGGPTAEPPPVTKPPDPAATPAPLPTPGATPGAGYIEGAPEPLPAPTPAPGALPTPGASPAPGRNGGGRR